MPKKNNSSLTNENHQPNLFGPHLLTASIDKLKWRKPGYGDTTPPKVPSNNKVQFVHVTDPNTFYSRDAEIQLNKDFEFTDAPFSDEENGKRFFHAVSLNEATGKYQSFKVFVLDKFPTKLAFRANNILSSEMQDFEWKGQKSGGQAAVGEYGGQYQFRFILREDIDDKFPKAEQTYAQTMLLKQDFSGKKIRTDKNITEYVAGRLMNLFAGDSSSTTFLASSDLSKNLPDPTGNNIYVGSIYIDNYQDFFRDIERVHGRIPAKDMKRPVAVGSLNKKWFNHGLLDPETKECRFQNFETVLAICLLLNDYDAHSANFGVIANRDNENPDDSMAFKRDDMGNIETDGEGKIGKFVKIDHAGALENLEDEVHMDIFRFWLALSGNSAFTTQPTNHLREYPRHLRVSPKMVAELERMSHYDSTKVKTEIDDIFTELTKFYGVTPLLEFGERMQADIKGYLRSIYGSDVNYNNIVAGKYLTNNSPELAADVSQYLKDFLTTKMTKRLASMQQLAVDMKVSLCFKMENGQHIVNPDSPFNLKDILNQHPDYITNDKFHFRAPGQKGIIQSLLSPFQPHSLKDLALQSSSDAAVQILRDSLGPKTISNAPSHYSVTFYKTELSGKITTPIPAGTQYMVVTDTAFKQSVYRKEKSPTLSAQLSPNQDIGLKPGEYGLCFVDSNKAGDKGLFIAKYTATADYQISAHRLPPEISPRYIYADFILQHVKQDLLSADPAISQIVRDLTARLYKEDDTIKFDKLTQAERDYLLRLLEINEVAITDLNQISPALLNAERAVSTQRLEFDGKDHEIPSEAFLNYAEMQCELMMNTSGPATVIKILPDPKLAGKFCDVKNPLLTQAYMLVCQKNNWPFENLTNIPAFKPQFLEFCAEHLRNLAHQKHLSLSLPVK